MSDYEVDQSLYQDLVSLRHRLHQIPETGFDVEKTSSQIVKFLNRYDFDRCIRVAGNGLIFSFNGSEQASILPGLMLRAELDALPIIEKNDIPYKSQHNGKAHLCGHDGHMAMMCGVIDYVANLKAQNKLKKNVHFLFQPSEEDGQGIAAILDDPEFDLTPDYVFALHNIPGAPLGQVLYKREQFTPEVISVDFKIDGHTAHAAQPYLANSPIPAINAITQSMQDLYHCDNDDKMSGIDHDDVIISPVHIYMGQRDYGITAGHAEIGYTIRTLKPDTMQNFKDQVEQAVAEIKQNHKIDITLRWHEYFAANINHEQAIDILENALDQAKFSAHKISAPFEWGEDFGLLTQKFKGAMFGLGSGEDLQHLHSEFYDFPDSLIPHGIGIFSHIVDQYNLE